MRREILASIAALLLLTACASKPTTTGDAVGAGGGAGGGAGVATAPVAGGGGAAVAQAPRGGTGLGAGTAQEFNLEVGDRVFFAFDKYDLTPQARATLEKQAAWLRQYPNVRFTVEGHCDERGTREYNLALGERRANAVVAYLTQLGVAANRITMVSYGKEKPIALGSNEAAWAQNRRAVSVITSGAATN